ncbi:50S ribosomal protein L21 [Congregibacter sp.]|uniref:50S ribosomal protein L21 n=1 Tax=Congregibacter sp. TaxID=2744308 RepID=UPI003F6D260B
MYAVIESGGKQHRVTEGESLKLEKIEAATGDTIEFDRVLMLGGTNTQVGTPLVAGAKVTAEVVSQGRHAKVKIVKFNRRKHYRRETGHRQWFTEVRITGISA